METTVYKISEIGDVVGGGTPSTANAELWGGDIPWISPKDLTGYGSIYISHGENYLTQKGLKSGTKLLPKDTVLFSSRAPIGYVAIASNPICTNQGFKSVICNQKIVSPIFFYYYIKCNLDYIKLFGTGATFPEISGSAMKKIKVALPPLPTQQKIASILSTYDTLIENNTKRIRLLEQMAENLYKEWFVRFRFPGHENVEMENGLPKGWKIEKFGKYSSVKRGGSPRPIQDYISEKGLNWLKISDVTSFTSPFVFRIKECIKEEGLKKTVYRKAGTLVLSNSATPGISKILCIDTCIHDGWLYFEDSYFSNEYLFLFFKQERTNLLKLGNGAIFTNLKTDILKNYNMCIPSQDILSVFQTTIAPIFEQIKSLELQNQNLTRQRDLLLPRLMSGKLEVMVR